MKTKPALIFLIIAISALLFAFPAYLRCSNSAGNRLLSTDLSFENPDQADIFSCQHHQSKAFVSSIFTVKLLPGTILFDQIVRLWFSASSLDPEVSPLRC